MEFEDIAEASGFEFTSHEVVTGDKYVLNLFRIRKPDLGDAPVVFFQHGVLDSADAWVMHGEKSPALVAAAAGYDVWCGNQRGSRFSRKHETFDPDSKNSNERYNYWNFSFQEMAEQDAPAFIDRVLAETGRPTLTWVGHS